jgi:hypothetical protein
MVWIMCGSTPVAPRNVTPTDNALRKSGASAAENDGFRRASLLVPLTLEHGRIFSLSLWAVWTVVMAKVV